jgi:hypothetical protein
MLSYTSEAAVTGQPHTFLIASWINVSQSVCLPVETAVAALTTSWGDLNYQSNNFTTKTHKLIFSVNYSRDEMCSFERTVTILRQK